MNSFEFYNPTKIYFGEGAIKNLSKELGKYGPNVLLVYGGGSIKNNGIYNDVMQQMSENSKTVYELSGVTPNPRTDKVYEGIKLCKENSIDLILSVGGGSSIDCAKAIAVGAKTDKDFWQAFYLDQEECFDAIPLASVLTLAGTGSEMDWGSVISNIETKVKTAYHTIYMQPQFSILDPTYTYSLPKNQLINGTVDMMSHIFETYFSEPNVSNVSDDLSEALLKNIIENITVAVENQKDSVARSNLMWDSTLAINGLTALGKEEDWEVHQIEHQVSAFYDIPHGAGLAIITPHYMKYTYKYGLEKYVRFAKNVWHVDPIGKTDDEIALEGIEKTAQFFKQIGAPSTLSHFGIGEEKLGEIAKTVNLGGGYKILTAQDVENILKAAL